MKEMPKTPQSLIVRIQQQDEGEAWNEFHQIYAPIVIRFLKYKKVKSSDIMDISQEVFRAVSKGIKSFDLDSQNGRFRNWLLVVVTNKIKDHWRKYQREVHGSGDSEIHSLLMNIPFEEDQIRWDVEYKRETFNAAADKVRDHFSEQVWSAFWMTSIEGQPDEEVADKLNMKISNVYVCKSRVLKRLKEKVKELGGE